MKGKINEIFESIQGEGMYVGERQIFVRLSGCNLRCAYCDTDSSSFKEFEAGEALVEITKHRGRFHSVSFTGGEPLMQKDFLKELLSLTRRHGFVNYLETNGTLYDEMAELVSLVDIVAMDIKLPSSTGLKAYWEEHQKFIAACSRSELFLKAVVCETTTDSDIMQSIATIKEVRPNSILVLQADSGSKDMQKVGRIIESFRTLCHRSGIMACAIPQMHKIIGVK